MNIPLLKAKRCLAKFWKRNIFKYCFTFLLLLSGPTAFGQKKVTIQETIESIKHAYYCIDQDYHTDGQRVVWVKSYTRWEPDDLLVMKKEAAHILTFLTTAVKYNRFDVLEQLLPDYYRKNGGVKAFATDIEKTAK